MTPATLVRTILFAGLLVGLASADAQVQQIMRLVPGTQAELAVIAGKEFSSTVSDGARRAPAGGGWIYRLPALPGASVSLSCTGSPSLRVTVLSSDNTELPSSRQALTDGFLVRVSVGPKHPIGGLLSFRFQAGDSEAFLREATYVMTASDSNRNGIPDSLENLLGTAARPTRLPRPSRPMTSFQTPHPYSPENAVPTDAVLVFSSAADVLRSWRDAGYTVYCMGGFRDYETYVKANPAEVQTDHQGRQLSIENSYYMVPTAERNRRSAEYYLQAVRAGAQGVCPEEPEIFARAGYSEAFRQEWQAAYGAPWEPPHRDVDTRYRAEQLKASLTVRQIQTVLGSVEQEAPSVRRLLAVHSPITYSHWGIVMPHHALFQLPQVQEVIAQVWTGTARTPHRVVGVRAERTFPLAYLEYASMVGLLDGLAKPVWFLMDPVEDHPGRSMEDYRRNYIETLLASVLFPGVDRFEVMPWPSRIYGRVPGDYATVINTVVGALTECWRYPAQVRAGSGGIALLLADSLAFQRAEPAPSDFDGVYGLTMPLILRGVPVSVVSLDRFNDVRHFDRARVLLGSYDFLKPPSASSNATLAQWVQKGGALLMFGGTDAYDAVQQSWWRQAGDASPLDDLMRRLGITPKRLASGGIVAGQKVEAEELLRGDAAERNLRNRRRYTLDLTRYVSSTGSVCVRFEDVSPEDGWGPYVASAELRVGDQVMAAFRTGSELEARFLSVDEGSICDGQGRFADGTSYWEYRFDNLPPEKPVSLVVDMGNGFLVKAYSPAEPPSVLESADPQVHATLRRLQVPKAYRWTVYEPPDGATVLYRDAEGRAVVWYARVGTGTFLYCGLPPGYLTAHAQADRLMRDLVRRACAEVGAPFETASAFVGTRGPYTAVRALTATEQLSGRYVDLLSADLSVVTDPQIEAGRGVFLREVGSVTAGGILAVSGRLESAASGARATTFVVRAPEGTQGAARLKVAGAGAASVRAWDLWGRPVTVSTRRDGDTLLLRYGNRAEGVFVNVQWK